MTLGVQRRNVLRPLSPAPARSMAARAGGIGLEGQLAQDRSVTRRTRFRGPAAKPGALLERYQVVGNAGEAEPHHVRLAVADVLDDGLELRGSRSSGRSSSVSGRGTAPTAYRGAGGLRHHRADKTAHQTAWRRRWRIGHDHVTRRNVRKCALRRRVVARIRLLRQKSDTSAQRASASRCCTCAAAGRPSAGSRTSA